MFTGLVEEAGAVQDNDRGRIRIDCEQVLQDAKVGDSIAVNGCCLTVVAFGSHWWEADLSDETLSRTTLGALRPGARVNLERPLRVGDRLGGHIVAGHVDAVGEILAPAPDLAVAVPEALARYLVEKGSVAVDGVSLTVTEVIGGRFGVSVIDHTAQVTTLGGVGPGDEVNIEVDMLAKHVERLLGAHSTAASQTHEQERP